MIFYYDCHSIRAGKKEGEYISMHTHALNDRRYWQSSPKVPSRDWLS